MKNAVSDTLKSGFTKLLGLKKHDENGNEIPEPETPADAENLQNTENVTDSDTNTNTITTSTETEKN